MKKTVLVVLTIPIAAFVIFLLIGILLTKRFSEKKVEQLRNTIVKESEIPDSITLPFPVEKYLKFAINNGSDSPQMIKIFQSGELKTSEDSDWKKTSAVQYAVTGEPGFFQDADIVLAGPIWMNAFDYYIEGEGGFLIKILSGLTVTEKNGDEIDNEQLFKYLCGSVFYPQILTKNYIKWTAVDDSTSIGSVSTSNVNISVYFHFNRSGEVSSITSNDVFRSTHSGFEKAPCTVTFKNYTKKHGINIPAYFETAWNLKNGDFLFNKFHVDSLQILQ